MKKEILFFFTLIILINYGCDKASPVPDEITNQVDTQSISNTNLSGNSLGQVDPTDWVFDAKWMATETALLLTPTAAQLANTADTATVIPYLAIPNPLVSQFKWGFKTTKPAFLQIVITDNLLNVKWRQTLTTQVGANFVDVPMPETEYLTNRNYRLYYAFYCAAKGLYYKGHGDVAVRR